MHADAVGMPLHAARLSFWSHRLQERLVASSLAASAIFAPACASPTASLAEYEGEQTSTGSSPTSTAALKALAAVDGLSDACPAPRADAICDALRAAEASTGDEARKGYERARAAIAARVAAEPAETVVSDAAIRFYIRERQTALLAQRALGASADAPALDGFFAKHFPLYDASSFRVARAEIPAPAPATCAAPKEALLLFVGVIRSDHRDEWQEQLDALAAQNPCLAIERVDTGVFLSPEINQARGYATVERLDAKYGELPLHVIGYSQGATNALHMLVRNPDVAARTRSVLIANSAAHGSEVIDAVVAALDIRKEPGATCGALSEPYRQTCERSAGASRSIAEFLEEAITAFAADVAPGASANFDAFLDAHEAGLRSLSTEACDAFWRDHGDALPKGALYMSFRTVITDAANLPLSNALFHQMIVNAAPESPWNDMQVRVERQGIGGHLADREVPSYVAEGNHWQWHLTPREIPEALMPARMFEGMPRSALVVSYYDALREIGLMAGE